MLTLNNHKNVNMRASYAGPNRHRPNSDHEKRTFNGGFSLSVNEVSGKRLHSHCNHMKLKRFLWISGVFFVVVRRCNKNCRWNGIANVSVWMRMADNWNYIVIVVVRPRHFIVFAEMSVEIDNEISITHEILVVNHLELNAWQPNPVRHFSLLFFHVYHVNGTRTPLHSPSIHQHPPSTVASLSHTALQQKI